MIDLDPDKTAPVLANELATHFTAVTNENESLSLIDIPKVAEEGYVRHLDPREVARRLKKMKKPASRVDGDLPREIVSRAAEALSIPLTFIYNQSFKNRSWPRVWKTEVVVPIPKIPTPMGVKTLGQSR